MQRGDEPVRCAVRVQRVRRRLYLLRTVGKKLANPIVVLAVGGPPFSERESRQALVWIHGVAETSIWGVHCLPPALPLISGGCHDRLHVCLRHARTSSRACR